MSEQLSTRLARLGKRLATTGRKHRRLSDRINELQQRDICDSSVIRRLNKERKRLESEMHQYECLLKSSASPKAA